MCTLLASLVLLAGLFAFLSLAFFETDTYQSSRLPGLLDNAFIVTALVTFFVAMVVLVWGAR